MKRFATLALILPLIALACEPGTDVNSGSSSAANAQPSPVFDVPQLVSISIDGKTDDWGDKGFQVQTLCDAGQPSRNPQSIDDSRFRLGWTADGLVILLHVADDDAVETKEDGGFWNNDSVEVFLADKRGGKEMVQAIVSPGCAKDQPELRIETYEHRADKALKAKGKPRVQAARSKIQNGYVMEILIPWDQIGVSPELGREVAFQLYVNDRDTDCGRSQSIWYPIAHPHDDHARLHSIRLAKSASSPVTTIATGDYEDLRKTVINITCPAEYAGKSVAVMKPNGQTIVSGKLEKTGPRSGARLTAPLPSLDRPYERLNIRINGKDVSSCQMPRLAERRARAIMELPIVFDQFVFSGTQFPKCAFRQPGIAELLLGKTNVHVDFYDANYNKVTSAQTPGRYGAVVHFTDAAGMTYTRHFTLYRLAKPIEWWDLELQGNITLPEQFGADKQAVKRHGKFVNEIIKWSMATANENQCLLAVLLAGLEDGKNINEPPSTFNDPSTMDRQWWVGLKRKLNGYDKNDAKPFVCPKAKEGKPAIVLHKGTMAEAGMVKDAPKKIDAVLTEWSKDTDTPFIACVTRNGVVVLQKAYGTKKDGKPNDIHHATYMASLTKLMQGACMMMFVDQGRVDLDTPVGTYLPPLRDAKTSRPITVRDLFVHTAGMWGHWGDEDSDLVYKVAEFAPYLNVGKTLSYNGMDLALASKIMEQISGDTLPTIYKKHLFGPLGMNDTTAGNSSYDAESTAVDMAKLGQMLANRGSYGDKTFFSPETLQKMLPCKLTMCLGPETETQWGIGCVWYHNDPFGKNTFGHGSASSSTLRVDLDNNLIVAMTRSRAGSNFSKYHPKFLQTVRDCMIDPKNVSPEKTEINTKK